MAANVILPGMPRCAAMAAAPAARPAPSLRERKKARTREAIAAAALQRFAQDGYDAVTVASIAAAADVAPRTVFRYFPAKEELLFAEDEAIRAVIVGALTARPADEGAFAALRAAALTLAAGFDGRRAELAERQAVIEAAPALLARDRAKQARLESDVAAALRARGEPPDRASLLARIAGACFQEGLARWLAVRRGGPGLPARVNDAFDEAAAAG